MTIIEMLSALRSQGIHLWVEGEKLKYRAPHGALTAELKTQLAERKTELLAILRTGNPLLAEKLSPIAPAPRSGELPLSFAEEGLWLLEQLNPRSSAWNMQSRLRIDGPLAVPALQTALNRLVERQEILRTAFEFHDQRPSRIIAADLHVELPVFNVAASTIVEDEIRHFADHELKTPFDLSKVPLFRAKLLRLTDLEHILVITKHHLITDAWSSKLFLQELFAFYEAIAPDHAPALPDLPIQYADYAHWLRRLKNNEIESDYSYWKSQLNGMHVVELPCDKRRPAGRSFRGATQRSPLPLDLSGALKALGKNEKATPFMVLLAAFKILLQRDSGETDLVIGSTLAGRNRSELERLIGMFVNLLPLRSDLSGEPTFREILRRVREVCLDAYQHQDYPFEKLVQEIRPARDPSRSSLFQVLFNVTNLPPIPRQVEGLTLTEIAHAEETARFDLTVFTPETREGFEIIAVYNRDIFAIERITELLEQYRYLLEQVVDDPDRKIGDYSLVTASAKRRLPDPAAPLDDSWHGAVHDIFAAWAAKQPEKLAVQDPHEAWSYKELNERSNQLAHWLREKGLRTGEIVAIYAQRSAALVWALMGVLKAGGAFCIIDPSQPPLRVKECLRAVAPQALIEIGGACAPAAQMEKALESASIGRRITLPSLAAAGAEKFLSGYPTENPAVAVGPDDLAYVAFTSGTTGNPKPVLGRHGSLTHFSAWMAETFAMRESDRFSMLSGLSFNLLHRDVFTPLGLGATLCIPAPEDIAPGRLAQWLRREVISIVHLTPAMRQVLTAGAKTHLSSCRCAFFGGDLVRKNDVESFWELAPQAAIAIFYGATETQRAVGHFIIRPKNGNPGNHSDAPSLREVMPLGRGIKDVQLWVLSPSGGMAGIGEIGEICVRSPHLAKGYLGDDELTRERFITNPFTGIAGDRVYRTGEQGRYLPNGDVEFVGRGEDRVSIRGFRVELGEVETVLSRHRAVHEAVITAREDRMGNTQLAAYVVPKQDAAPTTSELRSYLAETLPEYMIPAHFILLERLPLSPAGKVDRGALPAPDGARPDMASEFVPPQTAVEEVLAQSWAELLGVERVGIRDNFFELGGHSLLAMQVIVRMRDVFRVDLPLKCLYDEPTVGGLAGGLARAANDPATLEKTASVLLQLAQLSDQEVESRLVEKTSRTGSGERP